MVEAWPVQVHILAQKLNYVFTNINLLQQALTHSTWANEHASELALQNHGDRPGPTPNAPRPRRPSAQVSYERLEFLGDAVLQLLSSVHLFQSLPQASEGVLSRRRAQLVREPTLAALALELDIAPHVRMGGSASHEPVPHSVLADIMEAILAAVYLDGGLQAAMAVFAPMVARLQHLGDEHIDHKTALQEACHKWSLPSPRYTVSGVTGPPHARTFHVALTVGADVCTRGEGTSKKAAEQLCARGALLALGLLQQS